MMIDRNLEEIKRIVEPDFPDLETEVNCVNIQNVYESLCPNGELARDIAGKTDFPNIAPPWPLTWYEYDGAYPDGAKLSSGVLYGCLPVDRGAKELMEIVDKYHLTDLTKLRWFVKYYYFLEFKKPPAFHPILKGRDLLESDGKSMLGDMFRFDPSPVIATDEEAQHEALTGLYPALFAMSLLHCRNTTVVDAEPRVKIDRKRNRIGQERSFFKFKVLDIKPMMSVLKKEGRIEQQGIRYALHICRGHFKDYRDGRGLFGKVKGLFWWDMHARGDETIGIVHKDYKVTA